MDDDLSDGVSDDSAVELVSDGENLLVVGQHRGDVESFLKSEGILAVARRLPMDRLVPLLRSSAELVKTASESIADSARWLKITPESAEAIKEYGLTDSGTPGISYAMAGTRGDIKSWIKVDSSAKAQLANPALLSGIAGALSQAARQHEAAQLRALLETLDRKLNEVLRNQRDDVVGALVGIEQELRAAWRVRERDGGVDAVTWSTIDNASREVRQIQAKALLRLSGVADDLERQKRVGDLRTRLDAARGEIRLWLSVVARCMTALDEHAVLALDFVSGVAPEKLDERRVTLDELRTEDRAELHDAIGALVRRLEDGAARANDHKVLHFRAVPEVIDRIDQARATVQNLCNAVGIEVSRAELTPIRWRDAAVQPRQWRNGAADVSAIAWEKSKPVLVPVAIAAATTVVAGALKGLSDSDSTQT